MIEENVQQAKAFYNEGAFDRAAEMLSRPIEVCRIFLFILLIFFRVAAYLKICLSIIVSVSVWWIYMNIGI